MKKCKCGGKIALCTTFINCAEPDQEPYIANKIEKCTGNCYDGREINFEPIMIIVNVCSECGKVFNCECDEQFDDALEVKE